MLKKVLLSAFAASLLFTSSVVAETTKLPTSAEVSEKATQKAAQKIDDRSVKLVHEALRSLKLASSALEELRENKMEDAQKDIEYALGKLETILSSKDVPKLLPVDQKVVVKNFIGSASDVDKALNNVRHLLSVHKVQEAIELLNSLQSEIEINVISLPLVTYPDALKLASKYILENQPNKAQDVLKVALSTFSETKEIVPIPLIATLRLVNVASDVAKDNKEQALRYLDTANDELDKAQKLGYVSKSATTYKELHSMINDIKEEIKGKNKAQKLFDNLVDKIKEFKEKIFSTDKVGD